MIPSVGGTQNSTSAISRTPTISIHGHITPASKMAPLSEPLDPVGHLQARSRLEHYLQPARMAVWYGVYLVSPSPEDLGPINHPVGIVQSIPNAEICLSIVPWLVIEYMVEMSSHPWWIEQLRKSPASRHLFLLYPLIGVIDFLTHNKFAYL